jgi:hypothetical protein
MSAAREQSKGPWKWAERLWLADGIHSIFTAVVTPYDLAVKKAAVKLTGIILSLWL